MRSEKCWLDVATSRSPLVLERHILVEWLGQKPDWSELEGRKFRRHDKNLVVEGRGRGGGCWRGLWDQGHVCSDEKELSDLKCYWEGEGGIADTGER